MLARFAAIATLGIVIFLAGCGLEKPAEETTHREKQDAIKEEGLTLCRSGESDYAIWLESSASPSERQAARELQAYVAECTGVTLPISEGEATGDEPMILLGCGENARRLGIEPSKEELGEQGFLAKTVGKNIAIAGTPEAGTLYGVRDFIERELGVRWYAPGVTRTPKRAQVVIEEQDRLFRPFLRWRYISYTWQGGDGEFRSRQHENNGKKGVDSPQGIQHSTDGMCHSYFTFVSPGEFFETHPEYFSEIGGKRMNGETQLCLTNPSVLDIVTERMLDRMRKHPEYLQHNFSQMDYYNNCQCAECTATNEKYGTQGGTQFWFVNKLAERTSKEFPDKLIGTLAYMYTEEPPKDMVMHPNVAVWLCHMYPSCDSHPVATCELNADYKRRAIEWSKVCRHLYIWHYVVNFAHYFTPFPNLRALASDIGFYRDMGVEGLFAQAMDKPGGGGEFDLLRGYLVAQLMWDPDQDADAVVRDFLDGYYGAAAEPIWEYITLLHDKVERENIHMHLYTNPAQGYLPDETLEQANALFDEAESAVKTDKTLLDRVQVARMPLLYARMFPRNGYDIKDSRLLFRQPIAGMDEIGQFVERATSHGFTAIREIGGEPRQLFLFGAAIGAGSRVITLENDYLSVDISLLLGGRALRITDKKTGECATAYNTTPNLTFPFSGGEVTCVGDTFGFFQGGIMDPAIPKTEPTKTSVTLQAQTSNGFALERTISLAPDRPVLAIAATVTNPGNSPRETVVRSHTDIDLGNVNETRVAFTNRAGAVVDKDMTEIIPGKRQGEHYYSEDCPKGEWTFTGPKGLRLTQRFAENAVDFTWLYAFPADLNDLEVELWSKKTTLGPGESMSLTQEIEVKAATQ